MRKNTTENRTETRKAENRKELYRVVYTYTAAVSPKARTQLTIHYKLFFFLFSMLYVSLCASELTERKICYSV